MIILTILFQLFLATPANASNCKTDLLELLNAAKVKVNNNKTELGAGCYKAATVGRSQGLPGCNFPELTTLTSLLTPLFNSAKNTCSNTCTTTDSKALCKSIVTKSNLRDKGITGVIQQINSSDGLVDAGKILNDSTDTLVIF
ncbi:MAG: hypothetical protein IT287_06075 [Bdellovibrionaceae bacterium]|nr:hypothetical protein [Pseudobdellovibrionaceae bacterium]